MQYVVVGIFGSYADAEAAVSDLELAGIEGEQVEVISDIDRGCANFEYTWRAFYQAARSTS